MATDPNYTTPGSRTDDRTTRRTAITLVIIAVVALLAYAIYAQSYRNNYTVSRNTNSGGSANVTGTTGNTSAGG